MMSAIVERTLPTDAAVRHFAATLSVAGAAESVAAMLETSGVFYALAPDDVELARLTEFNAGGLLPTAPKIHKDGYSIQGLPNSAGSAAMVISAECERLLSPVFWIHEPLLKASEAAREEHLLCHAIGAQLFIAHQRELMAVASIQNLLQRSLLSWHFLGWLTDGLRPFQSIEAAFDNAVLILVGSYDGESFLVWRRSRAAQIPALQAAL